LKDFFVQNYSPLLIAHLVSIIYKQLIANVTLLKTLSFTSLILSMQLIMGLYHTYLLNCLTSSVGIMGTSHNWLKSYLSNRSLSVTSDSYSSFILPSSCGVSKTLSWVPSFSQFMSQLFFQLYPLTVSINSNMLTIHSFLSSFSLHLYLAVSAASSGVSLLLTAGSSTMIWF